MNIRCIRSYCRVETNDLLYVTCSCGFSMNAHFGRGIASPRDEGVLVRSNREAHDVSSVSIKGQCGLS